MCLCLTEPLGSLKNSLNQHRAACVDGCEVTNAGLLLEETDVWEIALSHAPRHNFNASRRSSLCLPSWLINKRPRRLEPAAGQCRLKNILLRYASVEKTGVFINCSSNSQAFAFRHAAGLIDQIHPGIPAVEYRCKVVLFHRWGERSKFRSVLQAVDELPCPLPGLLETLSSVQNLGENLFIDTGNYFKLPRPEIKDRHLDSIFLLRSP